MAGHPFRNLSVHCAVSQSRGVICEKSQHGSPTAIASATLVTAKLPSGHLNIMRGCPDAVEAQSSRRREWPLIPDDEPLFSALDHWRWARPPSPAARQV